MAEKEHDAAEKASATAAAGRGTGEAATAGVPDAATAAPVMSKADRRQMRILAGIVIGLGLLLVAGLAVLVATVIMRAAGKPRATPPMQMVLPVPRGAVVEDMTLDGATLAIRLLHPGGREIVVLDARKGKVLRRLRLREQAGGD